MSDDGYDSMDAERDREWRLGPGKLIDCLADFEPEPSDDVEVLMSAHDGPVGLFYNGKRYRVVPE